MPLTRNGKKLFEAVKKGDAKLVKILLDKGFNIQTKFPEGFQETSWKTLLFYAVELEHKDVVELLLNKGADVNAKYPDGDSILEKAIAAVSRYDIIECLVFNGADFSNIDIDDGDYEIDEWERLSEIFGRMTNIKPSTKLYSQE